MTASHDVSSFTLTIHYTKNNPCVRDCRAVNPTHVNSKSDNVMTDETRTLSNITLCSKSNVYSRTDQLKITFLSPKESYFIVFNTVRSNEWSVSLKRTFRLVLLTLQATYLVTKVITSISCMVPKCRCMGLGSSSSQENLSHTNVRPPRFCTTTSGGCKMDG